ncbi:MAG: hypothetical protein M1832_004031 [Thelocarpon impressellum]|nr:MAG: hypothetical protein M1832_004031 [Thelocarpon impressellum]
MARPAYMDFQPRLIKGNAHQLAWLDESTLVKNGHQSQAIQRESDALKFVRQHTSIPVPEVYDTQCGEHGGKLVMQALPGKTLEEAWPIMSEASRTKTKAQLTAYFAQLRSLQQPSPGWIGSCNRGPAYDHRVNNGWPCGPFDSVAAFHDFLVRPVANCPKPELVETFRRALTQSDDCKIVFTHADFCSEHVLLDPRTGDVTGIVDWEMAGWWPDYWEYNKARYGKGDNPWWVGLLHEVMPSYERECKLDKELEPF